MVATVDIGALFSRRGALFSRLRNFAPLGLAILLSACTHTSTTGSSKLSALSVSDATGGFGRARMQLSQATGRVGKAAGDLGRAADRFGKAADEWLKSMKEPISGKLAFSEKFSLSDKFAFAGKPKAPRPPRIDNRAFLKFFDAETGKRLSEEDKRTAFTTQLASLASRRIGKPMRWRNEDSRVRGKVTSGPVFTVNGGLCRSYHHVIEMPDRKTTFDRVVCHSTKRGWQVVG